MSTPIILFVRMRPKPEHREAARAALAAIALESRAEPGCREFVVHSDLDREGDLCLYEIWDDEAALKSHLAQPYTSAVSRQFKAWLAEPPAATRLRRIA